MSPGCPLDPLGNLTGRQAGLCNLTTLLDLKRHSSSLGLGSSLISWAWRLLYSRNAAGFSGASPHCIVSPSWQLPGSQVNLPRAALLKLKSTNNLTHFELKWRMIFLLNFLRPSPCLMLLLFPIVAQNVPLLVAQFKSQDSLPSSVPTLPCSSHTKNCRTSQPATQKQAHFLIVTGEQQQEQSLQNPQKWKSVNTELRKPQASFGQATPSLSQDSGASETHQSVPTLPGDSISPEVQGQQQRHTQQRLTSSDTLRGLPGNFRNRCSLRANSQRSIHLGQGTGLSPPSPLWSWVKAARL